jgi:hypothetical protein
MTENQNLNTENDFPLCPACSSGKVRELSEVEKVVGYGLYELYDFIGGIKRLTSTYKCLDCDYDW